jgi:hypothetical protein
MDAIALICEWLGKNWAELAKLVIAVWAATVATVALSTWRRQSRAQRYADFLDQLTEAVHSFVSQVPRPISVVQLIKIGMEAHMPTVPKDEDPHVAGAIAYFKRRGAADYKVFAVELDAVRPAFFRLQFLAAKGQVLGFEGYELCQSAIANIGSQFTAAQGLATFIHSSADLYWENPMIVELVKKLVEIDASEMQKVVDVNYSVVHAFLRNAYASIYG